MASWLRKFNRKGADMSKESILSYESDSMNSDSQKPEGSLTEVHQINIGAVYNSLGSNGVNPLHSSTIRKRLVRRPSECSSETAPSYDSEFSNSSENNIWTKMLFPANKSMWDRIAGETLDQDEDEDDASHLIDPDLQGSSCQTLARRCGLSTLYEIRHFCLTCIKHPSICLFSLIAFGITCGTGIAALNMQRDQSITKAQHTATFIATETADWFTQEFRNAMLPLYAVQQAVMHSTYFDLLPSEIGPFPERIILGSNETLIKRNVSGICDDPYLQAKWKSIIDPVNEASELNGIVLAYTLFPGNVACLTEAPRSNNTEFFNARHDASFGFDPAHDINGKMASFWQSVLLDIFVNGTYNIFGPFKMGEASDEMFCGHLPILISGERQHTEDNVMQQDIKDNVVLDVHGRKVENAFGFVQNFLDWTALKHESNIYGLFEDNDIDFCLTKLEGPDANGAYTSKMLAESKDCGLLNDSNSIIVETESLSGIWYNRVGKPQGWGQSWYPWALAAVVVGSFLLAFLSALVLVERQLHRNLLYKCMPRRAIAKLHRGQTVLEKFNLVTIFFSDIVGFTAMSGEMRPIQVMKMLNELYIEFDKLVEKHGVYKVETIGDAYMVVGGAPERCSAPEAAERVALFALDAIEFVKIFRTKDGEKIRIRAGLASGPVVAGVVGQAMPRYCFFGNTVNFASRMESTSKTMKIQCHDITYRLLQDAPGRNTFALIERQEGDKLGVEVKGKGLTHTWWITSSRMKTVDDGCLKSDSLVLDIEAPRYVLPGVSETTQEEVGDIECPTALFNALTSQAWERIGQPDSSEVAATSDRDTMIRRLSSILRERLEQVVQVRDIRPTLERTVKTQIVQFVSAIEQTYSDVHFHSFQHAYHVTIAMNKLIDVLPKKATRETIPQDPLIKFSLVFAALVHDAGHTGMSNQILREQHHALAQRFDDEEVPIAERYSLELALGILHQEQFNALRATIAPADLDIIRFGKALFQSILCTDIASKKRMQLGIKRFAVASGPSLDSNICNCATCHNTNDGEVTDNDDAYAALCPVAYHFRAFMKEVGLTPSMQKKHPEEFVVKHCGLRQCVRIEHFMQVSDVSHLMQGWENFVKWNFRLYKEISACHTNGMCDDPSDSWFEGQIGFFEHYIIPLAKRTGIFFSDSFGSELVRLAEINLELWKEHGKMATDSMITGVKNDQEEEIVLQNIWLHSIR